MTSHFPAQIHSPPEIGSDGGSQTTRESHAVARALRFVSGLKKTDPVTVERLPARDSP
jgi:hypothetical protein